MRTILPELLERIFCQPYPLSFHISKEQHFPLDQDIKSPEGQHSHVLGIQAPSTFQIQLHVKLVGHRHQHPMDSLNADEVPSFQVLPKAFNHLHTKAVFVQSTPPTHFGPCHLVFEDYHPSNDCKSTNSEPPVTDLVSVNDTLGFLASP